MSSSLVSQQERETFIKEVYCALDSVESIDDASVGQAIHRFLWHSCNSLDKRKTLYNHAFNALRRYDILQPLLDDPDITEIMVNGTKPIFIESHGSIKQIELSFSSYDQLEAVIHRIVSGVNRSVNTAQPIVDARLRDGSRVSIVLPPISNCGPILTIRKFSRTPFQMGELVEFGMLTLEMATFLQNAVESKRSIFVSGGTGSGKTTLLNVLSQSILRSERVITIEDACELNLSHIDNWVALETRAANSEGMGEVNVKALIKTALRMRPDRLIVGEVRGSETLDMLQAMNTGHEGSMSTGHANSISDMLSRIETMAYSASQMPLEAITRMMASGLDLFVHVTRGIDGKRHISEIGELHYEPQKGLVLHSLFQSKGRGDSHWDKTN